MKCDHEHDDAAYVLGALSPAERATYERHLASCSFCREAVAEIAVMPGLLGRLDLNDFAQFTEPAPPRNRVPELLGAAQSARHRDRRASRWRAVGVALAAACLAVVAGVGGAVWRGAQQPAQPAPSSVPMVAMTPLVEGVPVSAQVGLTGTAWGTRVTMKCWYGNTGTSTKPYTFRLIAYGPDDAKEQVGSWVAAPGADLEMSGITRFPAQDLARLELVRYDGTPLLAYEPR